jgi:hypothetical protein
MSAGFRGSLRIHDNILDPLLLLLSVMKEKKINQHEMCV